jgi:transposase
VSDLRAVNARLRQVLADKDELIALVEEQNAELRRRLDMDSTNSSTPPSTDSIAAKAKRHKANSERKRSKNRQLGGQKGHPGSGLELAAEVDDTLPIEPAQCSTCGEDLSVAGQFAGFTPVQQWDIPPVTLTKVQFDLMRRACSAGHVTQAPGSGGSVRSGLLRPERAGVVGVYRLPQACQHGTDRRDARGTVSHSGVHRVRRVLPGSALPVSARRCVQAIRSAASAQISNHTWFCAKS